MSTTIPLTSFAFLIRTKSNPFTNFHSHCLLVHHSRSFSSPKFALCRDFLSGKNPIFRRRRRRRRRRRTLMGERVIQISALGSEDSEENVSVLEQEALVDGSSKIRVSPEFDFEATINRASKWLVSGLFAAFILWRHDAEALWAAMGSVLNSVLSVGLKRILNQARPVANVRSDPGMPSSHAQSIFFTFMFIILSMVEWLGWNEITAIFTAVLLAFGSYLSWLRVTQKLHSIDQVIVGAVVGSCFALTWFWSWDSLVSEAFNSQLWVRASIVSGSAICCLGFSLYVIRNWFRDER